MTDEIETLSEQLKQIRPIPDEPNPLELQVLKIMSDLTNLEEKVRHKSNQLRLLEISFEKLKII